MDGRSGDNSSTNEIAPWVWRVEESGGEWRRVVGQVAPLAKAWGKTWRLHQVGGGPCIGRISDDIIPASRRPADSISPTRSAIAALNRRQLTLLTEKVAHISDVPTA
jgi:hypothetical protein